MKRLIALILALTIILCSFSSCSKAEEADDTEKIGAEDETVPEDEPSEENVNSDTDNSESISDICAAVSTCVVEVTAEFNMITDGQYHYAMMSTGSGVIISSDGYILTADHVITDSDSGSLADAVTVRLNNSAEYEAEIIGSDPSSDIALLKVDAADLEFATVGNSDTVATGEQIIVAAYPLGELGVITFGTISATNRDINGEDDETTIIQITAAVKPGNSGGGLFNTRGELIGIVNGKEAESLGYAIPVNKAVYVAGELREHGYVTGKTYIEISIADITDSHTAYNYFGSTETGVYISLVQEGYNDGVLEYGDRITAVNGTEISSSAEVKEIISESEAGDTLTFTISRDSNLYDVEVMCFEYSPKNAISSEE